MIKSWDWSDNRTTLLVNMLRFVMIQRLQAETDSLDVDLTTYDDGHVQVNRNQWWPERYPQHSTWTEG